MKFKGKSGASFIEIIGVMGAVLVFLGVAWLIAHNWHKIPDFLKIIILVISTLSSLSLGVFARHSDYEKTGRALLILGALLYIASVFLIAQIYSTETTLQGIAWLFLLCWIGVIFSAYALDSPENVFVGLVTFLAWFVSQYMAFIEHEREFSIGILALGFLGIGILLYALNLWHKNTGHRFSMVYQFWTVFYFLAIVYLLSFQSLIPMFWENVFSFEGPFLFVLFLSSFALLVLLVGVVIALGKKTITTKEIFSFILVIVVFVSLLALTGFATGTTGSCYAASCYDFSKNQADCNSAPSELNCIWRTYEGDRDGNCERLYCPGLDEPT